MLRLLCCLLITFASAGVAARDVKYSSPNGGGCSDDEVAEVAAVNKAKVRPVRTPAPARESRSRPALHSDSAARPALRWHSFLPGMFR